MCEIKNIRRRCQVIGVDKIIRNERIIGMFQRLYNSDLISKCYASIAPRWMVLFVDMTLVFVSCLFSMYIVKTDNSTILSFDIDNIISTIVALLVFVTMSSVTKCHWGIIRYTGLEDAYRIFKMTSMSCVVLIILTLVGMLLFDGYRIFSIIEILEIGIFSFSFILLERLAIKSLYNKVSHDRIKRKRVIVLGSAINSIVLSNALLNEPDGAYRPVALLSLQGTRSGNNINGLPIHPFNPERIKEIFERYNSKTLIFLATHMELMKKGFADQFLEAGIELLLLNQVEEFSSEYERNDVSSYVYNIKIEDLLGREPIHTDNPGISKTIDNKVVMVTGAAGSIGSEIVRQVAMFKASSIILLDQAETPMHNLQLELEKNFPDIDIHPYIADIQNKDRLRQAFEKYHPHYVFHAAAYKHVPMMENNPTEAILTNVGGTRNVADLSMEYNVEKFVMISTDKAVNPTNVMGCSKRIAEIYVQSLFYHMKQNNDSCRTSFITTRFGNVLGSNGSVVPLFKEQIAQGGPVTVTHRDIIRYFMTIPEACNLVLEAGCMGHGGEIFVFDMGEPVKIYDLAKRMIRLSGLTPDVDIPIVETGLRPGEKLYEELLNDKEKTIATYHKKIMIAKVRNYEYDEVIKHINPMLDKAIKGESMEMVRCMKLLVPEFKSRNSVFEEIDTALEDEVKHEVIA